MVERVNVPKKYKTKDGHKLGVWVSEQRKNRELLSSERKSRLESIASWVWDVKATKREKWFIYLEEFVKQEGHAYVPQKYKTKDGENLGMWVCNLRGQKEKLSTENISRLDSLGFVWDANKNYWERGVSHFKKYAQVEGSVLVPLRYKSNDGFGLGSWVGEQRKHRSKLTQKQRYKLDSLGFDWAPKQNQWENWLSHLEIYVQEKGHARVTDTYTCPDGYKLGSWIQNQRTNARMGKMNSERKFILEALGFDWDPIKSDWEEGFYNLEKYVAKKKDALVPASEKLSNGFFLGQWVSNLRNSYKNGKVDPEKISKLNSLGFDWDPFLTRWEHCFSLLEKFVEKKGHARVPYAFILEGYHLGRWVSKIRKETVKKTTEQISRLDSLGFVWKVK